MGRGLSQNQRRILTYMRRPPSRIATVSRLQREAGIGASRPSLFRSLLSLERRGIVRRIGIGARHEQRWQLTEES